MKGRPSEVRRSLPGVYPRVCGGTKSPLMVHRRYQDRVYPRVCGGTTWLATSLRVRLALGLSPRVRGNRTLILDSEL